MNQPLTHRSRIMARLDRRPVDRTPWFPDLSYWLEVCGRKGTLPGKYRGLDLVGLHKHPDIDAGLPRHVYGDFMKVRYQDIEIARRREGPDTIVTETHTPVGTLTLRERIGTTIGDGAPVLEKKGDSSYCIWFRGPQWLESPFRTEFPVKSVEDFKVVEHILRRRVIKPNYAAMQAILDWIGPQGTCQMVAPRSPLARILHDYMGLSAGVLALFDHPAECERFMEVMEECDQQVFEIMTQSPARLVIFGDNVDNHSASPPLFAKYSVPYYRRRCELLHTAGKKVLVHMDGRLQGLLPLAQETGVDVLDGITPAPMNDYSIDDLKAALGDRLIAWAGVPANMFCGNHGRQEILDYAKKLMDTLGDQLILNVGDQFPPDGDIGLIEAVTGLVNG